jgi:hypothetical protein
MSTTVRRRRAALAGAEPLPPRRKWRAITLATLLLVPAYWAILAGVVSAASDEGVAPPAAGPLIAFGLALVPFAFLVLAFLSEHPRAAGAVVKAMLLAIVVGIPVSALAGDAVTGMVAGLGAGGIAALRTDQYNVTKARVLAVLAVSVYVFIVVRAAGEVGILVAPALPFASIGVADHLVERKMERRDAAAGTDRTRGRPSKSR